MPSRPKPWCIALLLLALISQSVTAMTMTCELQQGDDSHGMMAMAHAMADMHHHTGTSAQAEDLNHLSDCCNAMGHCLSVSCSLPAFNHFLSLTPIFATTAATDVYSSQFPVQPVSSLYRPPIFR